MQRLRTHGQFQAVLAGPRIAGTAHFVLHQRDLAEIGLLPTQRVATQASAFTEASPVSHESVFGAMVPKRWAKRAVTRNMIRRQVHEVAVAASALPAAAYVVRLRSGFDRRRFASASSTVLKKQVRDELMALFSGVGKGKSRPDQACTDQP